MTSKLLLERLLKTGDEFQISSCHAKDEHDYGNW